MVTIEFRPIAKRVDVPSGTGLLDAARLAGVVIDTPCGGEGTCGKCVVRILEGEVDCESFGALPEGMVAEGYVLACRSKVVRGPLAVLVPEAEGRLGGKLVEEDERYLVRHELLPKQWEFDPLAIKWLFHVPPAHLEGGRSDLDRLRRAVQREWGPSPVHVPLGVLRQVAETLREAGGQVTLTIVRTGEALHVVRIEPGDHTTRHFGIAVDVGTTTVAVQLVNLTLGEILSTRSDYNDQVECGLDVISRINYAQRPDRREELRRRVLATINRLIERVAKPHGVEPHEITNAVVSGNTTMTHLLLGLVPEYIRLAPYTPTVLEVPYVTAAELGLAINPDSWVCFSPCVGSYVGGDITAGLLCTDLVTDREEVCLFIDIGTNGEIVVGNRDFLMTCACSAGPAFEGGGISCGMRAALGAIERVEVDPVTGAPTVAAIGGVSPRGICGTGMMDLIANLFLAGWLDPAGRLRARPPVAEHPRRREAGGLRPCSGGAERHGPGAGGLGAGHRERAAGEGGDLLGLVAHASSTWASRPGTWRRSTSRAASGGSSTSRRPSSWACCPTCRASGSASSAMPR